MPWARTKLQLHEDYLRPRSVVTINYTGKNPEKFYDLIPELMVRIFRLSQHSIQEKKFAWHKGESDKFEATWEANKDLDRFSSHWVDVVIKGTTGKGEGTARITVEGALRTEYPQDTFWQRSLVYEIFRMFYHRVFYASAREKYFAEGRRLVSILVDELKKAARD